MATLKILGLKIDSLCDQRSDQGIEFSLNEIHRARLLASFYRGEDISVVTSADLITKTLTLQINEEQKKTDKDGECDRG